MNLSLSSNNTIGLGRLVILVVERGLPLVMELCNSRIVHTAKLYLIFIVLPYILDAESTSAKKITL